MHFRHSRGFSVFHEPQNRRGIFRKQLKGFFGASENISGVEKAVFMNNSILQSDRGSQCFREVQRQYAFLSHHPEIFGRVAPEQSYKTNGFVLGASFLRY